MCLGQPVGVHILCKSVQRTSSSWVMLFVWLRTSFPPCLSLGNLPRHLLCVNCHACARGVTVRFTATYGLFGGSENVESERPKVRMTSPTYLCDLRQVISFMPRCFLLLSVIIEVPSSKGCWEESLTHDKCLAHSKCSLKSSPLGLFITHKS